MISAPPPSGGDDRDPTKQGLDQDDAERFAVRDVQDDVRAGKLLVDDGTAPTNSTASPIPSASARVQPIGIVGVEIRARFTHDPQARPRLSASTRRILQAPVPGASSAAADRPRRSGHRRLPCASAPPLPRFGRRGGSMNGHAGQRRACASATKLELQMTALVGNRGELAEDPIHARRSLAVSRYLILVPDIRHANDRRSTASIDLCLARVREDDVAGSARMSLRARGSQPPSAAHRERGRRVGRAHRIPSRTASKVGPSSRKTQAGSTSGGALRSSPRMTSLEPPATPVCDTKADARQQSTPAGTRRTRDPGTRSATFGAINMAKDAIKWTIGL